MNTIINFVVTFLLSSQMVVNGVQVTSIEAEIMKVAFPNLYRKWRDLEAKNYPKKPKIIGYAPEDTNTAHKTISIYCSGRCEGKSRYFVVTLRMDQLGPIRIMRFFPPHPTEGAARLEQNRCISVKKLQEDWIECPSPTSVRNIVLRKWTFNWQQTDTWIIQMCQTETKKFYFDALKNTALNPGGILPAPYSYTTVDSPVKSQSTVGAQIDSFLTNHLQVKDWTLKENVRETLVNRYKDLDRFILPEKTTDMANLAFSKVRLSYDNDHFFAVFSSADDTSQDVIVLGVRTRSTFGELTDVLVWHKRVAAINVETAIHSFVQEDSSNFMLEYLHDQIQSEFEPITYTVHADYPDAELISVIDLRNDVYGIYATMCSTTGKYGNFTFAHALRKRNSGFEGETKLVLVDQAGLKFENETEACRAIMMHRVNSVVLRRSSSPTNEDFELFERLKHEITFDYLMSPPIDIKPLGNWTVTCGEVTGKVLFFGASWSNPKTTQAQNNNTSTEKIFQQVKFWVTVEELGLEVLKVGCLCSDDTDALMSTLYTYLFETPFPMLPMPVTRLALISYNVYVPDYELAEGQAFQLAKLRCPDVDDQWIDSAAIWIRSLAGSNITTEYFDEKTGLGFFTLIDKQTIKLIYVSPVVNDGMLTELLVDSWKTPMSYVEEWYAANTLPPSDMKNALDEYRKQYYPTSGVQSTTDGTSAETNEANVLVDVKHASADGRLLLVIFRKEDTTTSSPIMVALEDFKIVRGCQSYEELESCFNDRM